MKKKKPTKKQIMAAVAEFAGSDMIYNISVPHELRFELAQIKEHLIVYMWENYIKTLIYRLELEGLSSDDLLEIYGPDELLEEFAHWQIGYWEGVNEALANQDDEE